MRNRKFLVAGLIAIAALVAACSSSPSSKATGGSVTKEAAVEVGLICSCSGAFGKSVANSVKVFTAWVKAANAFGGLGGHPIKLTVKDDVADPAKAVTAAQSLIAKHVDVIVNESLVVAPWADAVAAAKIPVIGGNFTLSQFSSNSDFYPSGMTDDHQFYADLRTAKMAGVTKLGQVYCVEAPQCQEMVGPHKQFGKELGVPIVYSSSISATEPNYTAQCVAAQSAGATGLFVAQATTVLAHLVTDCARQDYHPIYIVQGPAFTLEVAAAIGPKDQMWASYGTLPFWSDAPLVQKMNAAVDRYYPGLRTKEKANSTQNTAFAWTGGLLLEQAVKAAGIGTGDTPTAEKLLTGLNSLRQEALGGWSPPLTFTAGKSHSTDCWFTTRTQNGKSELMNDGKLTCQKV